MKKRWFRSIMVFAVCFCMMAGIVFQAENVRADALDYLGKELDGSILTDDTESIGQYQNMARSTQYLLQGIVKITNNGGGKIGVGGFTLCTQTCSNVKLYLYLEQAKGDGGFYSYKSWKKESTNVDSLSFATELSVPKGYYYRLRGYHSCTKNGKTETGSSTTDGIYIG